MIKVLFSDHQSHNPLRKKITHYKILNRLTLNSMQTQNKNKAPLFWHQLCQQKT